MFQEYFFKSQESLATVIDFVDEELDNDDEENSKTKVSKDSENSSTQSSPREPASRRKDLQQNVPRKLTP